MPENDDTLKKANEDFGNIYGIAIIVFLLIVILFAYFTPDKTIHQSQTSTQSQRR